MIETIAILTVLIVLGVPIAVALGMTAIGFLAFGAVPFTIVPTLMFSGLENFVLLAMPLFMIAGEVMNRGKIADDLIELCSAFVGALRGGLAMVNIAASMVFAEISGSAVADVASLGTILIPQMVKRGYPKPFAAAITSASASIAIIIPPSITMIIYGAIAEQSVAKLFIAGIVPGILLGFALMAFSYVFALKYGWEAESRFQIMRCLRALRRAVWALTMPVIILGGILGGIFTPTEAAAVAVAAALFIGFFINRQITVFDVPAIVLTAAKRTSIVLLMIATSAILGWYLTNEGIPQRIAASVMALSDNPYIVMFWVNIMLIVLGMFLHGAAAMILVVPIAMPLVKLLGYDPIHFGIILTLNIAIGQQTPPVASVLMTASAVSGSKIGEIMYYNKWFVLCMFLVLMLVTYVPWLSLWLPNLLIRF
ncbi:MAG: TRAP transporter large permease [Proteobacteria bacterium]|nr:TRAP transporter large permease [Pseudomonadota bacterium]